MNGLTDSLVERKSEKLPAYDKYFFRDLLENANDLIQSVSADGSFVYVNRRWMDVLGYSEREVKDLKLSDIIHPDYIPKCMEIFKRVSRGEAFNKIETIFMTKNGQGIHVEGMSNPFYTIISLSPLVEYFVTSQGGKREKKSLKSQKGNSERFSRMLEILLFMLIKKDEFLT